MVRVNDNYLNLQGSYLFSEIAKRVNAYKKSNPETDIIKLGIGDVTRPLPQTVIKGLHAAVEEMAGEETFRGYGPEQGYDFLIKKIIQFEYDPLGVDISEDEVFVSDGSKCDTGNIQEIFGQDNIIAVTDPVYPVYVDTNVMAGRSGKAGSDGKYEKIEYLTCNSDNDFIPSLPEKKVDIIYLCYPNNPTGMTLPAEELKKWVDYAKENKSIILYDGAYEAYIREEGVIHSIYEIPGARDVAIEFRSFSKHAGFTGTRCAYTVVPKSVYAYDKNGDPVSLNKLWNRRQTTKFNGVPYIIQKGAESVFTEEGRIEIKAIIDYYMENAKIIREGLTKAGLTVFGGVNAPYIWLKTPNDMDSWEFFDLLLSKFNIVGTPGSGFGPAGKGYFRLTAFGSRENTIKAMKRIEKGF